VENRIEDEWILAEGLFPSFAGDIHLVVLSQTVAKYTMDLVRQLLTGSRLTFSSPGYLADANQ